MTIPSSKSLVGIFFGCGNGPRMSIKEDGRAFDGIQSEANMGDEAYLSYMGDGVIVHS